MRQSTTKPKTTRKKADGGTRIHATSFSREEEGSDDEGAISLNAIKNKYKPGAHITQKGKVFIYLKHGIGKFKSKKNIF